jgi:fructokinase
MANLDVITCGELLVDLVALDAEVKLADVRTFERAAGGAPANVAVGLARFGRSVGFLGQVGDDEFGHFLAATLSDQGVNIEGLRYCTEARTALAFVSRQENGERDFMFYRHPSADMLWQATQRDLAIPAACRIFHFGSISLISEPSRSSTLAAVDAARRAGALISYDPNLRLPLWPSESAAREGIFEGLKHANIVKLSIEELDFLTGEGDDLLSGLEKIWHETLRLIIVTHGAEGCHWLIGDDSDFLPGFSVTPVDTTGAGDAFMAGLLTGLLENDLNLKPISLIYALRLANAAGALTVTRRGAIPALPLRAELDEFLAAHDEDESP